MVGGSLRLDARNGTAGGKSTWAPAILRERYGAITCTWEAKFIGWRYVDGLCIVQLVGACRLHWLIPRFAAGIAIYPSRWI